MRNTLGLAIVGIAKLYPSTNSMVTVLECYCVSKDGNDRDRRAKSIMLQGVINTSFAGILCILEEVFKKCKDIHLIP